jgi:uncharacterized membrane protein
MKYELESIGLILLTIVAIVFTTLMFSGAAQWLAGVAWRLGLVSVAAQWTIYAMGLCVCVGFVLTVAGRLVVGDWWFR